MSVVSGPLNGVRVLDLTHVWAGPLAVRMLSDLGAEVVKVEAPAGRGPRVFPSTPIGGWLGGEPGDEPWNASALFTKLHRNRRSLCVDLKAPEGRALLLELVGQADVLVENFSARAMPAMTLDFDVLKDANPDLIYLSMPGYGSSGPYKERVAFGPVVEPMAGFTNMLGYGPKDLRNSAIALMDPFAATHAVAAVTSALRKRAETGCGMCIELSLHEGGVALNGPWLVERQLGGQPVCVGNAHPNMHPHGVYVCAGEDAWVAIACHTDAQRQALADLIDDERLSDEAITLWSSARSKNQAAEALQVLGIPAGPVNTTPEMLADEQVRERRYFAFHENHDVPMPGNPIRLPELDSSEWQRCPRLGEHNAEVLADWLGYDETQVDAHAAVLADKPPA